MSDTMAHRRIELSAAAAAMVVAGGLAGCAGAPEPYARPLVASPPAFAGQSAAPDGQWPAPAWWAAFGSRELDALIGEAQVNNHDLKATAARVEQARAIARAAGAALDPVVSADAAATRTRLAGSAASRSVSLGLGVGWDPDLWDRNRDARRSAEAALLASRYAEDALRLAVTADLAITYFQILALNDSLQVARDTLDNARRLLAVVERQKAAGRLSALELEQQRGVVAGAEAAIPPLQRQRRATLDALALLTGRSPDAMAVAAQPLTALTLPPAPLGLPARLLDQRPDIRQAEAALQGAHADIGAARKALLPRLQLGARAGAAAASPPALFEAGSVFTSLSVDVLATIFDGGRLDRQVDVARARQQELVESYRQSVLAAFRDVEDALAGVEHFATQEAAQREARRYAGNAYRLVEIRFRAGAADFLAVLDAQRTLINADAALNNTRFQRFAALVALYRALGGGWEANAEGAAAAATEATEASAAMAPSAPTVDKSPAGSAATAAP